MCSGAAWPSGSRTRWGGSGGRPDRHPEGRAQDPPRDSLPGAGSVPVLVLQVEKRHAHAAGSAAGGVAAEVRCLFRAHQGTYGSPRITADLRELGWRVSKNTAAGLMREQGLAARPGRGQLRRRCRPPIGTLARWHPCADSTSPATNVRVECHIGSWHLTILEYRPPWRSGIGSCWQCQVRVPCGARLLITPGRAGGLGSSLGDHFGRLPACSLSAGLPDGAVPGPGVQGR